MGHPGAKGSSVSQNVSQLIDEEIRAVIDKNYQRAETILQEHITILHKMADALMKWETIDREQIEDLMAGKDPRAPDNDNDSSKGNPVEMITKPQVKQELKSTSSGISTKPAGQV
jgi:cell division protease FtsH